MKVCFVGFGSMGKRHLQNFVFLMEQKKEKYRIDLFRNHEIFGKNPQKNSKEERQIDPEYRKYIHKIYDEIELLPLDYDIMFITNPTIYHYDTLRIFGKNAKHFFIEKPVFSQENADIDRLALRKDSIYYVACPLRYHPVIRYLKENIDFKKVFSLRAISSSYLPEWRSGSDYRKSYSARKELGGGVAIDLIHEWDYITDLIGVPQKVESMLEKVSRLELDTEDIAVYIAKAGNIMIELHLDYFGRKSIRKLELFMQDDTVTADLIENAVTYEKEGNKIVFAADRDDWQRMELEAFLDMTEGKRENVNTIQRAVGILKIAKGNI